MLKINKMSVKRFGTILVFAAAVGALVACQQASRSTEDRATETTADAHTEADGADVPYTIAERYFVKNDVTTLDSPKITDEVEFNRVFGPAAVMGEGGAPTQIDFDKQFAVAIVLGETDHETAIRVESVQRNAEGQLVVTYRTEVGSGQSFTIKPNLLLVLDKKFDGELVLNEERM